MVILNILIGAALLFFGRKVFWLFVAGVGFVAGMSLAANLFHGSEELSIIVGIVIGLIAALLALFVQHFAISLAGFLAGGYLAMQILPMLNIEVDGALWIVFIVGGIIGVILVNAVLDWALILLSTLAGASLMVDAFNLSDVIALVVFILLIATGIVYQSREIRKDRRKSH